MEQWIVRRRLRPEAAYRLLCVPNAGAGMLAFRGWPEAFSDGEVAFVQLPGRDGRRKEPIGPTIEDTADALCAALHELPPMPTVFFGHSMGGLVAFECARRFHRTGGKVAALAVSGRRAPACPDRYPPIAHLPLEAFIVEVQQRYGGIPDVILQDDALRALLLPVLRADMLMVESYRRDTAPGLICPILAYGGLDDPHTTDPELQAWASETSARVIVRHFAGGHFFIESARSSLIAALERDILDVTTPPSLET